MLFQTSNLYSKAFYSSTCGFIKTRFDIAEVCFTIIVLAVLPIDKCKKHCFELFVAIMLNPSFPCIMLSVLLRIMINTFNIL